MQQAVQQVVQEAPGWVQGTVEATGRVELAMGRVEGTSPWAKPRGHRTTQGVAGVVHWSTRAQTALVTPGTDSKGGTSRVGTSPGFQGRLKGGSDKVEEAGSSGSRGRAGQGRWSGCSLHRAAGSQ